MIKMTKKILIAEDDPVGQLVLEKFLKDERVRISCVDNGEDAVTLHELHGFDLIFMDIRMPRMDGLSAIKRIRKLNDEKARVPIICVTAYAMDGDDKKFLKAGADAYIAKPFNKEQITAATATYLASAQTA